MYESPKLNQDVVHVLNGEPANKLIWYLDSLHSIVDLPENLDETWATLHSIGAPIAKSLRWSEEKHKNFEVDEKLTGDSLEITWQTPCGTLHARREKNHFVEFPVKKIEDLDVWLFVKENTFHRLNPAVSKYDIDSLYCIPQSWSPIQQLIQFDTGVQNFYYFLMDGTSKMERLMAVMQAKNMERLKLSLDFASPVIYQPENTSTTAISPEYYERYSLNHIREAANLVHQAGKRYLVHMCGLIKNLIGLFVRTGMDGIHSVTPPPLGNTPFALVREKMKPDCTIIGRFNAEMWVGKGRQEIRRNLESILSKYMLRTPFMLWVTTDQFSNIHYHQIKVLKEVMESF